MLKPTISTVARMQLRLLDECPGVVRIGLQNAMDVVNRLPVIPEGNEALGEDGSSVGWYHAGAKSAVRVTLEERNESLAMQVVDASSSRNGYFGAADTPVKRKREEEGNVSPISVCQNITGNEWNFWSPRRETSDEKCLHMMSDAVKSYNFQSLNPSVLCQYNKFNREDCWPDMDVVKEQDDVSVCGSDYVFGKENMKPVGQYSSKLKSDFEEMQKGKKMKIDVNGEAMKGC